MAQPLDSLKLLPADTLSLHHSFGFNSSKRYNLYFLDDNTLITSTGNALIIINLKKMEQKYVLGLRDGSIGSIAVDPRRKYVAVGEVNRVSPNIYIFEYPSFSLYRVLRNGAELGYADLCFNRAGDKLASVGSNPDYMLTIWNWKQERALLRSKAFSQVLRRNRF